MNDSNRTKWVVRRAVAITAASVLAAICPSLVERAVAWATTPGTNGRIAFAADVHGDGERQIFTILADGSRLRQLTAFDADSWSPDWSPDGRRIAFTLDDGIRSRAMVMDGDGGAAHEVPTAGQAAFQPAFTPDGAHLVYECSCEQFGGDGVFLMRDDGSDAPGIRLSTNPFVDEGDANPEVSPDGRTVTFVRHQVEGELQALFAVNFDGSNTRELTSYELEVAIKHDWAPDGRHIVITPAADFPDGRTPNVATISADGTDLTMLTRFGGGSVSAFAGSYAPDGSAIAFRMQRKSGWGLWAIAPDGRGRRLIANLPWAPRLIDWGPLP
jgi:Tol biopolymer transport system component